MFLAQHPVALNAVRRMMHLIHSKMNLAECYSRVYYK